MPVFQAQAKVARRVTHQAMDGVAPMVGYAAPNTASRSTNAAGGSPTLRIRGSMAKNDETTRSCREGERRGMPLSQAQLKVTRRVTHQAMDGAAPMAG